MYSVCPRQMKQILCQCIYVMASSRPGRQIVNKNIVLGMTSFIPQSNRNSILKSDMFSDFVLQHGADVI